MAHETAKERAAKAARLHRSTDGPLANSRHNGVRWLEVRCLDCDHRAIVNVDDQLPVGRKTKGNI
jgi:hypothetical protein